MEKNTIGYIRDQFLRDISDDDQQKLSTWRSSHPEHEKMYQAIVRNPLAEDVSKMADEMRDEILEHVNNRIQRTVKRVFLAKISAAAASLLIILSISNYISYQKGLEKTSSQIVELTNPMGMKSSITLSDGTQVTLNAGTTLSYPTAFTTEKREVEIINGEAFFDVKHDKANPFIVRAEQVKVQVLGTKFNIKAYNEEDKIEVTLNEGKVEVGFENGNMIPMHPGQQVQYDKQTGKFYKRNVKLDNYTAWVYGKFYFDNRPLWKIVKQLERSFNVSIHITCNKLKNTAFSGDFVRGENLEQILKVMTASQRIGYKIEDGQVSIFPQ